MLKPPVGLTAQYVQASNEIIVTWKIDPASDNPDHVTVSLSVNGKIGAQQNFSGPAVSAQFNGPQVTQYAGETVEVDVSFALALNVPVPPAIAHVSVPASAGQPPPQAQQSTDAIPPDDLTVTAAANHSVSFSWRNHGIGNQGAYSNVLVGSWPATEVTNVDENGFLPGGTTQATLGPIYPNTGYQFRVKGREVEPPSVFYYPPHDWVYLNWVSPDGSIPEIGWSRGWFEVLPQNPDADSPMSLSPGNSVTATWRPGDVGEQLDLFLTAGIPTLGETMWTWWAQSLAWQPWRAVPSPLFAEGITAFAGAEVTALWAPYGEHLDLFVTATDGTVWSAWWEQDPLWSGWFPIHPETKFKPGAKVTAAWRPSGGVDHLDLFVIGGSGDSAMVYTTRWEHDTGWNEPWRPIRPSIRQRGMLPQAGAEVTAVWRPGTEHLDLFLTASDIVRSPATGSAWSTWWQPDTGWVEWYAVEPKGQLPPVIGELHAGASIAAIWSSPDRFELFASARDGTVMTTSWDVDQAWAEWTPVSTNGPASPKPFVVAPGAAVTVLTGDSTAGPGHVQIFGTGTDGVVGTTWRESENPQATWADWQPIHPEQTMLAGARVAALWRPNGSAERVHLDLFARGGDGHVWSIWWDKAFYY